MSPNFYFLFFCHLVKTITLGLQLYMDLFLEIASILVIWYCYLAFLDAGICFFGSVGRALDLLDGLKMKSGWRRMGYCRCLEIDVVDLFISQLVSLRLDI